MPQCFACNHEITDPKDHDVLEIIGNDPMDSGRLLKAFNYTPRPELQLHPLSLRL